MDNPTLPVVQLAEGPRPRAEVVTSPGSWDSDSERFNEDSDEDSDESEVDDEEYWEDDAAADSWLARFPGGSHLLYPQLFVVKPSGGKVISPSRHPNRNHSFLRFSSEIRNRIYGHYFNRDEEVKYPEEGHAPFRDCDGMEMQRIYLSSENVELKFLLSTALLQASRQLRHESMSVLFSSRVITVEWLYALPRLVEFLGKQGCAMVRYLDIVDSLNFRCHDRTGYRDILTSIMNFPHLEHLRIVVLWDSRRAMRCPTGPLWFDANELTDDGTLTKDAVPKMRSENIEMRWPEYETLNNLKAKKFTLATETVWEDRYLEFDRNHGAFPEISKSIQSHHARTQPAPSPGPADTSSISSQVLEEFEAIAIQPHSRAFTPSWDSDDEDSGNPTWQDTDSLANKTIPVYNFLREFFHNNITLRHLGREMPADTFVTFPTARKSTGSIMRDCAFCYLSERHCGYHSVPDQPPFESNRGEVNGGDENAKIWVTRFEDLSYVDMRETCRDLVKRMDDVGSLKHDEPPELLKVFQIFSHFGWFETPVSELLARLDAAVDVGWTGKRVDKNEVPPWDVLYREICSHYGFYGKGK